MESDKKLETLQEEIKLMKGEIKQSLASVRDYLLNMELPSSEFSTILAALGGDVSGTQKVTMEGSIANTRGTEPTESLKTESLKEEPEEPAHEQPEEEEVITEEEFPEDESESPLEDQSFSPEYNLEPEPEAEPFPEEADEPDKQGEVLMPKSGLPVEKELPMDYDMINTEVSQSTPKVNLLTNLISWVANAKKEIGHEQLITFLEVYGISGHLSPELKEVILHLAEITSEQSEDANTAEVWSQSMLTLHGILTGGDAPLHPVKPSWSDDDSETLPSEDETTEAEVEQPKEMPLKLKLVFPNGDGKSREFSIDLSPSVDNNES